MMKKVIFAAMVAMVSTGAMANEYCDSDKGAEQQAAADAPAVRYSATYMEENLMYSDHEEFMAYNGFND